MRPLALLDDSRRPRDRVMPWRRDCMLVSRSRARVCIHIIVSKTRGAPRGRFGAARLGAFSFFWHNFGARIPIRARPRTGGKNGPGRGRARENGTRKSKSHRNGQRMGPDSRATGAPQAHAQHCQPSRERNPRLAPRKSNSTTAHGADLSYVSHASRLATHAPRAHRLGF